MNKAVAAAAAALWAVLGAAPALAHVTVQPTEAPVGSFFRFSVRVPTEREDASTIKVELRLPPLAFVSFQDRPGWDRKVEMVELDEPLEVFGEEVTEVPGSVTWSGGKIQPHEFEEFGFSARVPDEQTTLEFPAIQTYDSGEVVRWIGPPDSDEPAARVTTVDIQAEEGQGQLGVIADVRGQVAQLERGSDEDDDSQMPATIAGFAGAGLGLLALIVALSRRRG